MSLSPIDPQTVFLRMGEVSKEQAKETKKEEKEQSFQVRSRLRKSGSADRSVSSAEATSEDQHVKEHEERGLPYNRPKFSKGGSKSTENSQENAKKDAPEYLSGLSLPKPLAGAKQHLGGEQRKEPEHTTTLTEKHCQIESRGYMSGDSLDPDLGQCIDIES